MRLLLDSHVLLWWDSDPGKLSDAQTDAISDPDNLVYVSAATAWELGIKVAAGKLKMRSVDAIAARFGFLELPISLAHGQASAALPMVHKDPFDWMLIAQSISEQMVLVTVDVRLTSYVVAIL